ncbi:MAG: acetyl-CoA carboxylase carboxyl transferase subunit beta [Christensenellaceae bacterium]|nr:acetyl-CoA carboxylase carboxyl transferase subunit beta [Christensenellaceae bacterium]
MLKNMFRKTKTQPNKQQAPARPAQPEIPPKDGTPCPACRTLLSPGQLSESLWVCPHCGYHFPINARKRIALLCDADSFAEMDSAITSVDCIGFPGYKTSLKAARLESAEEEGVLTGTAAIGGQPCALFVMEPFFMAGSMGSAAGEKITRLFEYATAQSLPVVGITVSGSDRIQEGALALMQMAKTSAAVKQHSQAGNLYIPLLADPTTGSVAASIAMEGDIILAEPDACIGFADSYQIAQTVRQKLPQGFQRAEFLLETGFIDATVDRRLQKETLSALLAMHSKGGQN